MKIFIFLAALSLSGLIAWVTRKVMKSVECGERDLYADSTYFALWLGAFGTLMSGFVAAVLAVDLVKEWLS